jgi:hypothetical protein
MKEMLQRGLGLKSSRGAGCLIFSLAQKVVHVAGSTEKLRIRHDKEQNHFEGIATGDEFWFQSSYPSSQVLA